MTVVYLDSVFVLNALMDYVLLLSSARLAGIELNRRRYLAAALLGGGYAAAVFLPGWECLSQSPAKLAAGVLMAVIAFGGEEKLLRLTLVFFALSCALAGGVLLLGMAAGGGIPTAGGVFYTDVNVGVLLSAATAAYLLMAVVFRASARSGMEGRLLPVKVCMGGRTVEITALWDSGNSLTEPGTGRSVMVVARSAGCRLLPYVREPDVSAMETVLRKEPALRPLLLPFRSVGMEGLLLSIRSEWTEIDRQRYQGLRVAVAPRELGEGYTALWGGEMRGGRHENLGNNQRKTGAAGPAAGRGHSLYRRQRYSAAAAGAGKGGTVAGTAGGRECPAGIDRA